MMKYLHRVLELDPVTRMARVQPSTVLDTLRNQAEQYHLTSCSRGLACASCRSHESSRSEWLCPLLRPGDRA